MRQYEATIFVYDEEENEIELEVKGWYTPSEGDGWNSPHIEAGWEDIQIFQNGVELTDDELDSDMTDAAEEALWEVYVAEQEQMMEDRAEARYAARQDADKDWGDKWFNGGW